MMGMSTESQAVKCTVVIVLIHHLCGWNCVFSCGWIVHIKTKSHLYDGNSVMLGFEHDPKTLKTVAK